MFSAVCVATLALAAVGLDPPPDVKPCNNGGLGGGGPIVSHDHAGCIPAAARAEIRRSVDAFYARHGAAPGYEPRSGGLYAFWPQAGQLFRELGGNTFVDLDPSGAILSYDCGFLTYDGHRGVDVDLRSFGEQLIGVPVFAALPGTVVAREDGHFDMNVGGATDAGNYVIVAHPGGRETWYFHLKNGSVGVQLGDPVVAGQQVGLTASSGYSGGPHLHFETQLAGQAREPFAGVCRPGPSDWVNQPAHPTATYLSDMGFSYTDLATVPGWPHASPRTGQLALSDDTHWIWTNVNYLPAQSTFRFRWYRPNGTLSYETPVYPFDNPSFYGRAWFWFQWNIGEMHSITGTWRVQMEINGALMFDSPIEVRTQRTAGFNRPPAPLQGVSFDPAAPTPADVVFCRVACDLINDDPDYDILRYRYVWRVDGATVRDVTTAGLADAIPVGLLHPGALLECTVTPRDAAVNGPSASTSYALPGACNADYNQDGGADTSDIIDLANDVASGQQSYPPNSPDFNNDGGADTGDVIDIANVVAGGPCP